MNIRHPDGAATPHQLSELTAASAEIVTTATLIVKTSGPGFTEITDDAARFLTAAGARDGALLLFLRHTSASLVIQENADPDVQADLATALERLVPIGQRWRHDSEGPDDMPSHVKAMLTGISLHVAVAGGARSCCNSSDPAADRSRAQNRQDAQQENQQENQE